jgi:hypothetical protein
MASLKLLADVTHNIGHHATSGVCYVVPHLFRACAAASEFSVALDLLKDPSLPSHLMADEPLLLSMASLSEKFLALLVGVKLGPADISKATLSFAFSPEWPQTVAVAAILTRRGERVYAEDPAYLCTSSVVSRTGKPFEASFKSWHYGAPP